MVLIIFNNIGTKCSNNFGSIGSLSTTSSSFSSTMVVYLFFPEMSSSPAQLQKPQTLVINPQLTVQKSCVQALNVNSNVC